jgi:hypothetical protein
METFDRWNRQYDELPGMWRFQVVLLPLILIGLINMWLTIHGGFPFGLLVLLAIIALAAIRLPYANRPPAAPAAPEGVEAGSARSAPRIESGFLTDVNTWFDGLPAVRKFLAIPLLLVLVGWLNMELTIVHAFPFGLLFLIAFAAVVFIRAPWELGLVSEPSWREARAPALRLEPPQPAKPLLSAPHEDAAPPHYGTGGGPGGSP